MERQILITLGREFGSGGHKIAQIMAEKLGISYYDKNILDHIFDSEHSQIDDISKYDEKTAHPLFTRRVRGHTNSMEEIIAKKQFEFIQKKADSGESFVIVGRCGETILREYDGLVSFFVLADKYDKIHRVMDRENRSKHEAIFRIQKMDATRKKYHNYYSDIKWGDARGYDLCVNASCLGIEKTAEVLIEFVNKKFDL
ncbi:MAG: cytidylate kinase-like family protein [Lachnospiraceae bacterium]|nr:cytidylate kinase-like family protein [Lachnospiraceae bacterium]